MYIIWDNKHGEHKPTQWVKPVVAAMVDTVFTHAGHCPHCLP